jgi:hypothetical protein
MISGSAEKAKREEEKTIKNNVSTLCILNVLLHQGERLNNPS